MSFGPIVTRYLVFSSVIVPWASTSKPFESVTLILTRSRNSLTSVISLCFGTANVGCVFTENGRSAPSSREPLRPSSSLKGSSSFSSIPYIVVPVPIAPEAVSAPDSEDTSRTTPVSVRTPEPAPAPDPVRAPEAVIVVPLPTRAPVPITREPVSVLPSITMFRDPDEINILVSGSSSGSDRDPVSVDASSVIFKLPDAVSTSAPVPV